MTLPSLSPNALFPSPLQTLLDGVFQPGPKVEPILLPSGQGGLLGGAETGPMTIVCTTQPATPLYSVPTDPLGGLLDVRG